MNQLADKVVAYSLPEEGGEEMFGLCIRREGETLRVMVLQRDDNREAPLKSVLRKLSDEDGIVNSLENRFSSLQSKLAKECGSGAQGKSYRLQETMLQWATRRLDSVNAEEWRRLSQDRHPSAVVKAVGCAAASIAAEAKVVSSAWSDAQRLFGKAKDMVVSLRQAAERQMSKSLYNSLEEGYITDSSLSYAFVAQESQPLGILHKWITALVDYQRVRYMEDGEVELQQQLTGCENSLQSARVRRGSLMEQAEQINTGNCYIRTQTVRSVPIECVRHLLTAEKVTTRQYLLKEVASADALGEIMRMPPASARSARGSRQEDSADILGCLSARNGDSARLGVNRTNSGVAVPRILLPAAEPTPAAQQPAASSGPASSNKTRPGSNAAVGGDALAAVFQVSPRHALAPHTAAAATSGVATPLALHGRGSPRGATVVTSPPPSSSSAALSPCILSSRAEVRQPSEPATHGRALTAMHGGTEPMQVLTDVRNNFKNVQDVLLACLADYQALEDKYANTVEHSRQLLLTLESRDQAIARLQRDLFAATAALSTRGAAAPSSHTVGMNGTTTAHAMREAALTGRATPSGDEALAGGDDFKRRWEQLLYDTLDFLQGAAAAPTAYDGEVTAS